MRNKFIWLQNELKLLLYETSTWCGIIFAIALIIPCSRNVMNELLLNICKLALLLCTNIINNQNFLNRIGDASGIAIVSILTLVIRNKK